MDVFDLVAKIKLDTDEYEKGLDDAESKAGSFGSKLKSGLGTAAKVGGVALLGTVAASVKLGKSLADGANELANYGDHIDKMSQKMGISAEAYQEWDAVLQHSGTSIDSMQRGMMTLSKAAVDNKEEFEKLNITEEELATLSQEDLFGKVIEGLQGMDEGAERAATAQALLGGAAKELGPLLNTSAEDTQAMKDRVHELGGVMSDEAVKASAQFKDNLQDMQTALDGAKRSITSETLPAFNSLMEGFTMLIAGEDGADQKLDEGMDKLNQAIDNIMPKIGDLLEKLLPRVLEFGMKLVSGIAEQLPKIITSIAKQIPALIKMLVQAISKTLPQLVKAGVDLIKSLADGMSNGDGEVLDMIMELIDSLIDAILDNLPALIDAGLTIVENLVLGILQKLPDLITAAADIVVKLIEGITKMLPEILAKGKDVILNIVHGITQNLPQIIQAVVQVINTLLTTITENLPEILQAGIEILIELTTGLLDAIPDLVAAIPQIITALVDGLLSLDNLGKLLDTGLQLIGELVEGLMDFVLHAGGYAWDIIQALVDALGSLLWKALNIGKDIMTEIWNGLKEVFSKVIDWAKKAGKAIVDAINPFKSASSLTDMFESVKAQAGVSSGTSGGSSGSDYSYKYKHYAKAMNDAYILDGATIFGAMDGSYLQGGERGQEMIVGTDYLASMMREAYREVNQTGQDQKIIIPVYIGQERIDEIVVDAVNRSNYITGGR